MSRGFTFIQLSVFITIVSLVLVACLPSLQTPIANASQTTERMNTILLALRQFESSYGRIPCPADASQPIGSTAYGMEAAGGGSSTNCAGSSPAANSIDATNHVAIGMLPVRSLGLPSNYALDAWGRDFTYAVDTNATICFPEAITGALSINDNGAAFNAVAIILSHGRDGHGAWLPYTGSSGTAVRLNSGSQDTDELTNAHLNNSFTPTLPFTNFVRKSFSPTFGNLVSYQNPQWNLSNSPLSASAIFPLLGAPGNGTYIAGQNLTFTLTYPQNVTVSGTPQLKLTLGSATQYANYTGGSGTKVLSFSYTLQSADYAPSGIIISSPVNANGATLSAACNSFVIPTLTGIMVKKLYLYITDYNNNRVDVFDANGNYLFKFGAAGSLLGLFSTPMAPAIDALGNVWVSDWGNSRVEEFSSTGTYLSQFGSLGLLNGQFINSGAITIDNSGNMWVVDQGNNRVEKFSSTGSYLSQFGSGGILNGQFAVPTGIAVDTLGNIWVGDWGNSRVQKFNSSGVYQTKFGALGTSNGLFINPSGLAFAPSGNLWVTDNGNNRVQEFNSSGGYVGQFGSFGHGNGQFVGPTGIAIDVAGNIWISDAGNNRVQEFNSSGIYQNQFGSYGNGNGQFSTPAGIALLYQ